MKPWNKILVPVLILALALCACQKKSPPPSDTTAPTDTAAPVPTASPTETAVPVFVSDPPSESPAPPVDWSENVGVAVSSQTWSDSYKAGGDTYLTAEISLPKLSGVPDAVGTFYTAEMTGFKARCGDWAGEAKDMLQTGSLTRPYTLNQSYMVACNHGGILSVLREEELDLGGMHPETAVYCETFRVSDGRWLQLDDFFTVPREQYQPVLLAKVIEDLGKHPEDFNENWKTEANAMFPYDTFCVSPEGISLFYRELSLGSYALGIIRVDISWTDLRDIWTLP